MKENKHLCDSDKRMNNKNFYIAYYDGPIGKIMLASNGKELTGLWFEGQKYFGSTLAKEPIEKDLPIFEQTKRWLDLYFEGQVPNFLVPLCFETTPFRKRVWDILLTIPYGETRTYGQIAKKIARQKGIEQMSAQAIGNAVGHNPILLIVPCHRVIGSNESLTGYAGGIEKKAWLLAWEKTHSEQNINLE